MSIQNTRLIQRHHSPPLRRPIRSFRFSRWISKRNAPPLTALQIRIRRRVLVSHITSDRTFHARKKVRRWYYTCLGGLIISTLGTISSPQHARRHSLRSHSPPRPLARRSKNVSCDTTSVSMVSFTIRQRAVASSLRRTKTVVHCGNELKVSCRAVWVCVCACECYGQLSMSAIGAIALRQVCNK